jgi:hypothetical protein
VVEQQGMEYSADDDDDSQESSAFGEVCTFGHHQQVWFVLCMSRAYHGFGWEACQHQMN